MEQRHYSLIPFKVCVSYQTYGGDDVTKLTITLCYVDDLLSGDNSLKEAGHLQDSLIAF